MASASVGTVKVQVKPDIEGFRSDVRAALFAMGARDILVEYSKWLAAKGFVQDGLKLDAVVDAFIEEQCEKMRHLSDD